MIDSNLDLLEAAIAQLESDLMWLKRLRSAITRGDEAARLAILRERGTFS